MLQPLYLWPCSHYLKFFKATDVCQAERQEKLLNEELYRISYKWKLKKRFHRPESEVDIQHSTEECCFFSQKQSVSHNLLFKQQCDYGNTCFHKNSESVNIASRLVHASWLNAHDMQSVQNRQVSAEEASD